LILHTPPACALLVPFYPLAPMTIETIALNAPTFCLSAEATLEDALRHMLAEGVNHAPVCQGREWVGMLSMRDLVGAVLPEGPRMSHGLADLALSGDADDVVLQRLRGLGGRQVGELVRRDVPILKRDHRLAEAAVLIFQEAMPLPVLGSDGSFLGMLSPRALMQHLVERAGSGRH